MGDGQSLTWLATKAEGDENPDHVICQSDLRNYFNLRFFFVPFPRLLFYPCSSMLGTPPAPCGHTANL
jgi:hypothetical protein